MMRMEFGWGRHHLHLFPTKRLNARFGKHDEWTKTCRIQKEFDLNVERTISYQK